MFEIVSFFMFFMAMLTVLAHASSTAHAHGYVESPPARAFTYSGRFPNQTLNWNQRHAMIGSASDNPHGMETCQGWPAQGSCSGGTGHIPRDGQIASADCLHGCGLIDRQTSTLWSKTDISPGPQPFTWFYTIGHATRRWEYFITKPNWNPDAPLTRDQFDLTPITTVEWDMSFVGSYGTRSTHMVNIPADRNGYHIVLAIWTIGDTQMAFYNVVDLNIVGGTGPTTPAPQPEPEPQPEPQPENTPIFNNQALHLATALNGITRIQANGNQVALNEPTTGQHQVWQFNLNPNGQSYTIQNTTDGRYITEANNSLSLTDTATTASNWRVVPGVNNTYQILNTETGRSFDVEGGNTTANGTRIITWSNTGNPNQRWHLSEASTYIPTPEPEPQPEPELEYPTPTPVPTGPLNPPTHLHITGQTETTISLAWQPSQNAVPVKNYEIFRNGIKIATVPGYATTFIDTGLSSGGTYNYTVRAHAASEHSNTATGTTEVITETAPTLTGPTQLKATSTSLSLQWNPSTSTHGVLGYRIYRNHAVVGEVGPQTTTFVDAGLVPNTLYTYAVKAFDQFGNEAYSPNMTVNTMIN
ncbi:MAG: lytic polysaccharide monooxygenase [Defluviitaleaceae bacterium]|nr:lytic polysaccharide monooxygenase [Defluviitaleaceae bacterium]